MTADERELMIALCERISKEKDSEKFNQLVKELNELLDGKSLRVDGEMKPN